MASVYRSIFSQSLKIILKNKILFIFGLFATIFNNFEIYNLIQSKDMDTPVGGWLLLIKEMLNLQNLLEILKNNPLNFTLLMFSIICFIVFALIFIWLAVTSQTVIIQNVHSFYQKTKFNLSDALLNAKENFWPVLKINATSKILLFVLSILINFPLLGILLVKNKVSVLSSEFLYVLLFIIFFILTSIIYFIFIYAIGYVVIKKYQIKKAIFFGYGLFKKYWMISIEMACFLFVINALVTLVSSFFIYFLTAFLLFLSAMTLSFIGYSFFILMLLLWILLIILIISGLALFHLASWILLFEKLTTEKPISKIQRLTQKFNKPLARKI